jgi:hypothetical protein
VVYRVEITHAREAIQCIPQRNLLLEAKTDRLLILLGHKIR